MSRDPLANTLVHDILDHLPFYHNTLAMYIINYRVCVHHYNCDTSIETWIRNQVTITATCNVCHGTLVVMDIGHKTPNFVVVVNSLNNTPPKPKVVFTNIDLYCYEDLSADPYAYLYCDDVL